MDNGNGKRKSQVPFGRKICSLGRFPKSQLTLNGLSAHQIKLHTKDNLSQAKATDVCVLIKPITMNLHTT